MAGIPEAGLIVLPLVLSAAGLPDTVIAAAIPLIMTVDWIIARALSGVNVMSDMLVAILLDAGTQRLLPNQPRHGTSRSRSGVPNLRSPSSLIALQCSLLSHGHGRTSA